MLKQKEFLKIYYSVLQIFYDSTFSFNYVTGKMEWWNFASLIFTTLKCLNLGTRKQLCFENIRH